MMSKYVIRKWCVSVFGKIFVLTFDCEKYQSIESSKYSHYKTSGLANYKGKALAVGCEKDFSDCSFATELFDLNTMKWSDGPKFPFGYG